MRRRGDRVEVLVRRRAGGRFAAPQRIGGDTAFEAPPTLVLSPGGVVVAAWTQPRDAHTGAAAVLRRGGRRFGVAGGIPAGEPTTSILAGERPDGGDLGIAAGRSGALLAFATVLQTGGGTGSCERCTSPATARGRSRGSAQAGGAQAPRTRSSSLLAAGEPAGLATGSAAQVSSARA